MVTVRIHYFAQLPELAGKALDTFELPSTSSSAEILAAVSERYPQAAALCACSRVAVDQTFISGACTLSAQSEVAIIPPVSGG